MKKAKILFFCMIICLIITVILLSGCSSPSTNHDSGNNGADQSDSSTAPTQETEYLFDGSKIYHWKGSSPNPVIDATTPDGKPVTAIGSKVFQDKKIKTVTIPKSVTRIDGYAFSGCDKLEAVYFEGSLNEWCSIDFNLDGSSNPIAATASTKLYCNGEEIKGDVILSAGIDKIAPYALYNYSAITSLTIPDGVKVIGEYAFNECTALASLSLPSSLRVIGKGAFSHSAIRELTLPDSLESIGERAFYNNQRLNTVDFGSGITSIGDSAFALCRSLQNFTLPSGLTELGNAAFSECSSITSFTLPKSITVVLPWLLRGCASLTDINLHEGVTELGAGAFNNCQSITDFTLPSGVSVISNSLFEGCSSLDSMPINENITEIGNRAYGHCGFSEIIIPDSVTKIGERAFLGCSKAETVKIPATAKISDSAYLFDDCDNIKSADIPSSLLSSLSASHSVIEALVISESEAITAQDFSALTSLVRLTIPKSVTSIEKGALPLTLKELYFLGDIADWAKVSFSDDISTQLEALYINGRNAYLDGDLALIIDGDTEIINAYQFKGFKCLGSLTLGKNIEKIEYSAFEGCENIEKLDYLGTLESWCGIKIYDQTTSPLYYGAELNICGEALPSRLVIDSDVSEIESYCFLNQTKIEELIFKSADTSVSYFAFNGCTNIRYAEGNGYVFESIIGDMKSYPALESVIVKGEYPADFSKCTNLLTITYENGVPFGIGAYQLEGTAFYNDSKNWANGSLYLQNTLLVAGAEMISGAELVVPDGTIRIGSGAFDSLNKDSITSVTLPEGLLSIGNEAFSGMPIRKIVLPDSVTTLGNKALGNMEKLESITVGTDFNQGYDSAFLGTSVVELVNYSKIDSNSFALDYLYSVKGEGSFNTTSTGIYYYQNADQQIIKHIISYSGNESVLDLTGYSAINEYAFKGHTELLELTLACSIIARGAFEDCSSLRKLTLLNSVVYINEDAFSGCGNFEEVTIKNFRLITYTKKYNGYDPTIDYIEENYGSLDGTESDETMVKIFNDEIATANQMSILHT